MNLLQRLVQFGFQLSCLVLFAIVISTAHGQQASENNISDESSAVSQNSGVSVDSDQQMTERQRYIATELLAVEQLILMLSNRPDQDGAPQEALVFLGRSPQKGWEAIGLEDVEELRSHWRTVATRLLARYTQSDLSSEKKEKMELAVELSITQFIRLYSNLRTDFMQQSDQKARLALLTSDNRYEHLRLLGREGLFKENTLLGKAMHTILSEAAE